MDDTDADQEARRERLRQWIKARGGHTAVVLERRLNPSQASYVSQVCNGYSFGPRAARGMETRLGMPNRWLDADQPALVTTSPTERVDLSAALPVVLEALSGLPPARAASVRAQLDLVMGHPEMHDDVLAELQTLLAAPVAEPGKRQRAGT